MSIYVVDASVAVKWFLEEDLSLDASKLLESAHSPHAPEFLDLELDHVLCKRVRRDELTAGEAEEIPEMVGSFPVRKHPTSMLRDPAFDLACASGRGIYDCLYLILARYLGTRMVTADRRLCDALAEGPLGRYLCWVEDIGKEQDQQDYPVGRSVQ